MDEGEITRSDTKGKDPDPEFEAWKKRLENLNVQEELTRLTDDFNAALKRPPKETSGLVEMQKWFAKWREQLEKKGGAPTA